MQIEPEVLYDEDGNPVTPDPESGTIQALRQQNKKLAAEAATAKAEAEAATRRAVFVEVGIPMNPRNRYFIEGYQGEMTVEAIRAKAIEDGFLDPPADPGPAVDPGELAQHQQAASLAAGGEAGDVGDPLQEGMAALARTSTQEEAIAVARQYGVRIADDFI